MKNKIFVALVCVGLISCGEQEMRQWVEVSNKTHEFNFENATVKMLGTIDFSDKGAGFLGKDFPAYILLDSLNLNNSEERNISMWFRFEGEDARIPQMLFSIQDTINQNKRFNVWIAGRRVTSVLNSNHLWANDYDYRNGRSKVYYDSFRLEEGKYYFLSINYSPEKVEIYVNAELYNQFGNIENGLLDFHTIFLGIEAKKDEFEHPFFGHIKNLTLFDRTLTQNEIYSLSVESYSGIERYNKEFELNKFEF